MFTRYNSYGFRDKEGDDKGGGGSGESAEKIATRLLEQAKGMISGKGAEQAIVTLLTENKEYRDEIRALKGRVPKEGSTVLTSEDVKLFERLKNLGKVEDVEKMVNEHASLLAFKTERESMDGIRDVARRMGWNADVLVDITNARKLKYELKDVKRKKEGTTETETVKEPYVKVDGSTEAVPLADFAKDALSVYMPALTAAGNGGQGSGDNRSRKFPSQSGSDQGSGGSVVDKEIQRQRERQQKVTNPLMAPPAKAT